MRQIRAFRSGWTGAFLLSKSIAFAVILSLGCSVVANESDGGPQEIQVNAIQPSHTVVIGDTLWNVALRLRPQGMAMAQAMDAVYEHNPEAFLEADSTKLIEGSVVTFPNALAEIKAPEIVVSAENSSLSIPLLEPIAVPSVESTELIAEEPVQKQDTAVDDLPEEKALPEAEVETDVDVVADVVAEVAVEVDEKIQESLLVVEPETASQLPNTELEELPVDDVKADESMLLIENAVEDKPSEAVVEPPSTQPIQVKHTEVNQPVQVEPVNQLEQFLAQLKSQDTNQTIAKLKQLPVDLWFFVAAILIAIIINRSKRKSRDDSSSQSSEDSLAESVLDGPFAEGDDQDDVFTAAVEQPTKGKAKDKSPASDEDQEQESAEIAMNLPGLDELKAQLSEDSDPAKPLAKDFEPVSFEEDTLEIDPLQIKLDMASLCIEMGDIESAQSILEEIISEADKQGKAKAREILDSIET